MNTVDKGDIFELEAFELFKRLMLEGSLFVNPKYSSIYHKKGYYSHDRQKEIVVDISIETRLPEQSHYSLLTVIECKNYDGSIPVDDIEEFNSKLQQIAGENVKGIVATPSVFQEGALTYASSRKIALVRILPENEILWEVNRRPSERITVEHIRRRDLDILRALTSGDYSSDTNRIFSSIGSNLCHSLEQTMQLLIMAGANQGLDSAPAGLVAEKKFLAIQRVKFLSSDVLEKMAYDLLESIAPGAVHKATETPLDRVREYLESKMGVLFDFNSDLGFDHSGSQVLGRMTSSPFRISVSSAIQSDYERWRFTLSHEIAHCVLGHHRNLNKETYGSSQYESEGSFFLQDKSIERMEIQANVFAAFLLLPRDAVTQKLLQLMERLDIRPRTGSVLFVDNQTCNLVAFNSITAMMKSTFKVSKRAIEAHLTNLGLLTDHRRQTRPLFGRVQA